MEDNGNFYFYLNLKNVNVFNLNTLLKLPYANKKVTQNFKHILKIFIINMF